MQNLQLSDDAREHTRVHYKDFPPPYTISVFPLSFSINKNKKYLCCFFVPKTWFRDSWLVARGQSPEADESTWLAQSSRRPVRVNFVDGGFGCARSWAVIVCLCPRGVLCVDSANLGAFQGWNPVLGLPKNGAIMDC